MKILDCKHFKEMLISSANNLENKRAEIDKLNVFPVPDGDTGTNMSMTFCHGVNETSQYMNNHVGDTAKFLSKNMLMGARGNSGVILSQVFKGIANELTGLQTITVEEFAKAIVNGSRVAYKAVMRPVEGTILTVVRETADYGFHYVNTKKSSSFEDLVAYMLKEARESLTRTPDILPVLKEANVVDSGAAGFVTILEGWNAYFEGKPINLTNSKEVNADNEGFCVEVIADLNDFYKKEFSESRLETSLSRNCNNVKIARENNELKLHVHTMKPGEILTTIQRFGDMKSIKVENISVSHNEQIKFDTISKKTSKYAIISVCNGQGIQDLFKSYKVDYIINGGQTMNPATEDFVNIINQIRAEHIIILPNNSNIILAADQAKEICNDVDVHVLESKSIPEGICACINFNSDADIKTNIDNMKQAIGSVKTISITKAIKDTSFNSIQIHKNDYLGLLGKEIVISNSDLLKTTKFVIDQLKDEMAYLTILYGSQIDKATAQQVLDYASKEYDAEGEIVSGQQDLYPFIIGVE